MTQAEDLEFKDDVRKAYARAGRKSPHSNSLKDDARIWTSVSFHLYKNLSWRHREVDVNLFLDLVEADLWKTFLSDTNEDIFRDEVVRVTDSQELAEFVSACMKSSDPFYFGRGVYEQQIHIATRAPTEGSGWSDLLASWRLNREIPIEWVLLLLK